MEVTLYEALVTSYFCKRGNGSVLSGPLLDSVQHSVF